MIESLIASILSNYTVTLIILGILLASASIFRRPAPRNHILVIDRLLAYLLLCAVGFSGLYACMAHTLFSEATAEFIGWQPSPFQYEVGMANLALGVLGIVAFRADADFRAATIIAVSIILLGAWAGHIYQQVVHDNFAPGNAGSIFYTDLLIPLILLTLYWIRYRPQKRP